MIDFERELENSEMLICYTECEVCDGLGGFDASTDCETYDDWRDCDVCDGTGVLYRDTL